MATEADVPAPTCETQRREEVGDVLDQAANTSINKLHQEEKIQVDTPNEPPTTEGENSLRTPSIGEVHSDANSVFSKGIKQYAERAETQLSKDTTSDHHGMNDSEVENLNVQVKTEDDMSFNIMSDVSKESECPNDQNMMTSETINEATSNSDDLRSKNQEKTIDAVDTQKEVLESFSTVVSSCPDEGLRENVQGVMSDSTDRKTIKEVDTKKEVLENFSTISNDEIEENSTINVDVSETKNAEELGKESKETSSQLPLAREAIDDESTVMHEVQIEGELREAETCETEKSTETTLSKIEAEIEKPNDSFYVVSKDAKASDLALDEKTEDKTVDATEIKEETQKDVGIVSNEKNEENSMIQMDCSEMEREEHLQKERETPSLTEALTEEADDKESDNTQACKDRDDDGTKAELLENEKDMSSTSVNEEAHLEMPIESLQVANEDINEFDSSKDAKMSSTDEQILTTDAQEISCDKIGEKNIDAAETNEETLQKLGTIISNEKPEENSLIQVDGSCMENEAYLEKEIENTSLKEASKDEAKNIDSTQDYKKSAASEDIETTCSLEEQSLTGHPQVIMGDRTVDGTETNEETLENVATIATQEEHLEKESGTSSLMEAPKEENNGEESKNMHERGNRDEDVINDEFLENEKYLESNLVKEEAQEEKPVDSSQIATKDVNECDSSQDSKTSSIEEQILTTDAQEVSIEEKTLDAAETKEETPEDKSPIDEDSSQKPSSEEALTCNVNEDESKITDEAKSVDESSRKTDLFENEKNAEDISVQDRDTSSPEERSLTADCGGTICDHKDDETNNATSLEEETLEDKNVTTTIPYEDEKEKSLEQDDCSQMEQNEHLQKESGKESTSLVEEQRTHSLQVATEDIKASAPGQDTEEIFGENEEKTIDPPHKNEETVDVQNVATIIPHEDTQENSLIQVDCSEKEHDEYREKESESPSSNEAATEETNEDESRSMRKPENGDNDVFEAELLENETVSTVVNEEATLEKSNDCSQVDIEDIKESYSCQDTKMRSIEERVLTIDPHEISSAKIEGKGIGDNESPIEDNGSQKPNLEEDLIDTSNNDESTIKHEAEFVDESSTKANSSENEKNTENTSVNEEVSTESLQVAAVEDIEASIQDRETSSLEEQSLAVKSERTVGDHEKDKKNDATSMQEEAPQDKSVGTTILYEQEKSLEQDDCLQVEQNEDLKMEIEIPSLTEARTWDTKESIMEEAPEEEAIDSLQVATEAKILTTEEIVGDDIEEKPIDLPYKNDETPENVSNEDTQGNSIIQVDCSKMEHEKHLERAAMEETNEDGPRNIHESENRDDDEIKAKLLENEQYTTSTLMKEEVCLEKPIDSSHVNTEDINESDSSQGTKISSVKEQILTANPQETSSDKIEGKTIDAAETEEETQEDIVANVPSGDNEDKPSIEEDGSQKPSLEEASTLDANEQEATIMHDVKYVDESSARTDLSENEKKTEDTLVKDEVSIKSLQVAAEDIKAFALIQDRETSSIEEQSVTTNCQEIAGEYDEDKISNAIGMKEQTPDDKNVTTSIPYKNTEEHSLNQGDCLQMEHNERSEKESESPSLTEKTNEDESKNIHEPENRDDDLIRAELLETENCTESTSVKEEAHVEESIDSLQVSTEDIKASDSSQDTKISSIEEQILIAETQEISGGEIKERTIDAVDSSEDTLEDTPINVPNGDNEDNSLIKEDDLLESEKNIEDTSVKEEVPGDIKAFDSVRDIETSSLKDQGLPADCQGIVGDDTKDKTADATSMMQRESTSIIKEQEVEKPVDSLQLASEDIKTNASCQNIETSSTEEQILTTDPQETSCVNTEEKTIDATHINEETVEVQNVKTTISREDSEENSLNKVDCPQIEQKEHLEKESEDISLTKAPIVNIVERTLVTEEAHVEKLINSFQVASEDVKASSSGPDQETSSIEEQIQTADRQAIPGDSVEEKTIDAVCREEEILEDMGTNISNGDKEDSSPIKVDEPQKPSFEEASTGNATDYEPTIMHEAKFADENLVEAKLSENEKNREDILEKEEVSIESVQVSAEDIKTFTLGQDRETSSLEERSLTPNPQEITGDHKEEKTIDATKLKEETPEYKNVSTIIPSEDKEEKSLEQDDCSHMEHHENTSEIPYLTEARTRDTEEQEVEKPVDSLQLAREDIKAVASCQNTSSTEEQILTTDPQEISYVNTEEKTIDAAHVNEETVENVTTTISHEDSEENSLNQVDCPQIEQKEHLEKESEDICLTKAPMVDTVERTLVKEEVQVEKLIDSFEVASEDVKASSSGPDQEASSIEEQIQTADRQAIPGDRVEETIDAVCKEEEILEDMGTNISNGDNEDSSPIKVDEPQKPSFEEVSTGNATDYEPTITHEAKFMDENLVEAKLSENEKIREDILVKEEVSIESIESVQVAAEDIKTSTLGQDRETSSLEEQSLTPNPREITGDHKEDKTIDATKLNEETPENKNVSTIIPSEDKEEKLLEQDDCSQMEHHENESEIPSLTEARTRDTEEREVEKPVDSLQLASEDIKAVASCQNTETSSIEEQILTTDSQEISYVNTEEKTIDSAHIKEETVENVTTTTSHEDSEENSLNQVDCPQIEQKEHLEKESEEIFLTKASIEDTVERTLVKEEAQVEKLIDPFQVVNEDVKASSSGPDQETSSIEEQIQTADRQAIPLDNIEEKTIDVVCEEEEILEDMATTISNGDNEDSSPIKVDEPQKLSFEEASTGNATDYEPTITHEAKFADENLVEAKLSENEKNREDILVKEEVSIESVQVAAEDVKTSTLGQERETSSLEEKSLTPNPQEVTGDHKEDKPIDATKLKEETPENKNVATTIPQEDAKENSIIQVDGSQVEHEEHVEKESENSSSREAPTVKEEITEDTKPSASTQVTEISSIEETILTEHPQENSGGNIGEKTIDATETKEETLEVQVSKEIENVDIKAKTTELNEEEGYLSDLQTTTAVNIKAREEQGSDSSAIKIPNVDKDMIVDIAEDPNCKQDGSSIPNVSEEHVNISKNVADVTSLVSEASELNSDHKVVEEANSCGDETNTEKVGVLDDGSITIPSNDNLVETEAKEITEAEAQVPDGEKEAQLIQQEPEAGTNQKEIEELPIRASHDGSESNRVNGEEEKGSDYCKEISESSDSLALEEVSSSNVVLGELSTSNVVQESISITEQEVVNEEAQKQDEDLHVLALTKDSSVEKMEKDAQLCLTSAHVSDITQELQKLEEASGTSADEKIDEIIEKTDHEESEVVEHSTQDKYIEHLDQDGTTKSFLDDQKPTESEQEEKELKADTTESAVGLEDNLTNGRSIVNLETKIDEAPEITETTPNVIEGQEIESRSVGETSVLMSQCEKDEYEHASIGSVIEKSDTNEVEFAHGEYKSVYESKNQVLESIAQVQSCDIISKAEETKTDEEKLEVAVEINSVAEDRSEPKETTRVDISSNKIKEEHELVEDYHLGSCKEEVKEDEIKTEEILDEVIKNANDTENVLKVSGEADDKAIVEPKDNLLDRSVHLEECTKGVEEFVTALDTKETQVLDHIHIKTGTEDSIKEVNSSSVEFPEDGDNRKGAGGIDNELEEDEGLLNQNSNTSVLDAAALPKRLDEDIICEAAPTKTVQKTVEESEDKKENANTTMMEQQEVDNISEHESLPLPGFAPGRESEKRDQKDEICSSHEVQAKDEENQTLSARKSEEAHEADICSKPDEDEDRNTYAEAEKLEFSSHTKDTSEVSHSDGAAHGIPEDNKNSTIINEQSEEKYQNKSTESQISTVSKDIQLIEEGPKATSVTAEMQERLAGSYSSAVPEQTGVDSRQVDEVSDECQGIKETSTSIQPSKISKSEIIQEYKVGTSSAAEHQLTELHDLPQESHLVGSEVKMAQRDGPMDLQKVTDVSEDVQKLKEGCIDVLNKENAVVPNPDENIEVMVSSKEQEAEAIQKASASETFNADIEQQLGRTFEAVTKAKGANYEEEKTLDNECSDLIENSCSTVTEMVSKSNIHQSSMEDTTQGYVENKESQQQTVLVATSPPEKDKHAIREADHTKNVNPEDSLGNENITVVQHGSSAECSQGEGELSKPSKQEEAHCGHEEEKTSQETTKSSDKSESKETYERSLSDLLQVSVKETSQKAYHSTTEKEPTTHSEKTDEAKLEDVKTDEEKDDEEESSEQRRSDLGFEAPVMVDVGDTDVKVTHKKSHNILSGVGSKVKHSIAKVKKAITGKSSHSKPMSPKEGDKYSKTNVS